MFKGLYCIYDTVAKETNGPFVANNDAHARIMYDQALKKAKDAGFVQDFQLLKCASIDLTTGVIVACDGGPQDVTYTFDDAKEDE